jgi:hypothetical protein
MNLTPLPSVPIQWQNTLVDVQPTSQYGREFDRAVVSTNLLLQVPPDEDVSFILPSTDPSEEPPQLRMLSEPDVLTAEFDEEDAATAAQMAADVIAAQGTADQAQAETVLQVVRDGARKWQRTNVHLREGTQLVRFTSRQRIPPLEDGGFEFTVLAPLTIFLLTPGGSISFALGLPRIPGRTIGVDHAVAENPPGTYLADISERPVLAGRMFIGHFWQNDPLYRVKYRYPPP